MGVCCVMRGSLLGLAEGPGPRHSGRVDPRPTARTSSAWSASVSWRMPSRIGPRHDPACLNGRCSPRSWRRRRCGCGPRLADDQRCRRRRPTMPLCVRIGVLWRSRQTPRTRRSCVPRGDPLLPDVVGRPEQVGCLAARSSSFGSPLHCTGVARRPSCPPLTVICHPRLVERGRGRPLHLVLQEVYVEMG